MSVTKIATVTVGSGGAASIDFTSIPGTMTDLMVVVSTRASDGYPDTGIWIQFNGSTSSYTRRTLYGTGDGGKASTTASDIFFYSPATTATANTFGNSTFYIPNYAGSTNKSVSVDTVNENNAAYSLSGITAGLWSNTAAITSIKIVSATASNLLQYSTATLYGITKGSLAGVTVS
jgi:hypothetical protein